MLALALVLGFARSARADKVDTLIERLTNSNDYKERLSAALNLTKMGDPRAVPALIGALDDSDKTVRGVSAAGLGKLITSDTSEKLRTQAMTELKRVATKDDNEFVRKQAQKAYDAIKDIESGGGRAAGIYVDIGPMSDDAGAGKPLLAMMRTTVTKTFSKNASAMSTSWPGGKAPSKKQLDAKGAAGFHVDGTIVSLDVDNRGASTLVSCNVSMLIATYPEKSMFGFLKGGAKVQAGTSEKDIGYAKEDCVVAVVEDLVKRKIIPAIEQRSR